ncbi:metallophosphoesterase [bacterium]|nr:metallophosphoesterase [bacterium]
MKTLVLSDIHANIVALETIWAQEGDADLILCTGDLVDYGPFPREVLDWVRAHNVICTQGNHDLWTVMNFQEGRTLSSVAEAECAWVHYTVEHLTADDIGFLAGLPTATTVDLDGQPHGLTHLYNGYEEIVSLHAFSEFNDTTFADGSLARLILGHTHRQSIRYLSNDHLWINPGSTSYRRKDDPDQTAHYATIVDGSIQLHRLAYDLRPLRAALETIHLKESEMRVARHFWGAR